MRRWSALSGETRETFWRSLHAMNGTRVPLVGSTTPVAMTALPFVTSEICWMMNCGSKRAFSRYTRSTVSRLST